MGLISKTLEYSLIGFRDAACLASAGNVGVSIVLYLVDFDVPHPLPTTLK